MISAVLIVKNEENYLPKCLESIKGVDEIIICDTGSTDKTIEVAHKYTDKVFTDYKWNDSFCEARNHALSKATGDWILSIDADETLESLEVVREAIKNNPNELVLNCTLQTRKGEQFKFPRVFKRCPDVFWKGSIHNYINQAPKVNTDIRINYEYSDAHKKDPDRALRILGKEVIKDPKCGREKFYLAREYWYRKDFESAIHWYEEYLKTAWWNMEMAEAELQITKCYCNLNNYTKAKEHCLKAILINADFKEALVIMSKLTGPKNRKKWEAFSELAENNDVLFVRNYN